ncbi:MurR/RpiR family transcriptional regulator [Roseospirillum parvum]|nr:MurR/RpiR family transcriptional regulator [Roseospirillum parvum]
MIADPQTSALPEATATPEASELAPNLTSELAPAEDAASALGERLRQRRDELSPQLRKAAHYLLAHPEEVALTSMRGLAAQAGVKASTMVRLARALGYDGFEALREPYRQWLRGNDGPAVARARTLQARARPDHGEGLIADMIDTDCRVLGEALGPDGRAALEQAAITLGQARRVYILGLRSCNALARLFHYAYGLACHNGVMVDGAGGSLFDTLRDLGPDDALLVISFKPYSREAVIAAEYAAERRARVVALTDSAVSPLAASATALLTVETSSPSYFQSLVPALALVQMLLALLVARGGEAALANLRHSQEQLDRFDAYWRRPRRGLRGAAGEPPST